MAIPQSSVQVDTTNLERILQRMVQVDSINPQLVPGAAGEGEIISFLERELDHPRIVLKTLEGTVGRPSLVATLRGQGSGRSLMLNAHIDTVGVENMPDPFSGAIRNGKLYGRGAYDMKGAAASCIGAILALANSEIRLAGDVVVSLVADEEYESVGIQEVIEYVQTDAAIVTEPTQLDVCLAHKGFVWLEVLTLGRAAHGSRYMDGIDANMHMGHILAELANVEREVREQTGHPLLGPPSMHAALISGGSGISTYSDQCKLQIERRTIPGETEGDVIGEVQQVLDRVAARIDNLRASVSSFCFRDAFEVSADAKIVEIVAKKTAEVRGQEPRMFGDTPWMDSAFLANAGIETVVIGPAGGGAHAAEEWVELDSVYALARILIQTALEYCEE